MLTQKSENDKLIECQIWKIKNDLKKSFLKKCLTKNDKFGKLKK